MSSIHNHTNNRSHSYGNLTDDNSTDFYYRTIDRQNGNIVKRTKSFWKFGKHDDILEGMAMWKHRDLVLTENEKNEERTIRETTLRRRKKSNDNNNTISTNSSETLKNGQTGQGGKQELLTSKVREIPIMSDSSKYLTKSGIDQRISKQQEENIYGAQKPRSTQNLSFNRGKVIRQSYVEDDMEKETRRQPRPEKYRGNRADTKIPSHNSSNRNANSSKAINGSKSHNNSKQNVNRKNLDYSYDSSHENMDSLSQSFDDSSLIMNDSSVRVHDSNFYDDDSVDDMQLMKTVKRQEILKQYYSSGTDTERNSSSSDPYDCIVVDDHLVRRKNDENKIPKMDFKTFRGDDKDSGMESSRTATLLPRTKLTKTTSNERGQNQTKHSADKQRHTNGKSESKRPSRDIENSSAKSYGPWYDLWAGDGTLKK